MESVIKFAYITVVFSLAHFPACYLKPPADGIYSSELVNSSISFLSETGPSCPNCGVYSRHRIVGGRDASIQEFSWIVRTQNILIQDGRPGAAIFHPKLVVLTDLFLILFLNSEFYCSFPNWAKADLKVVVKYYNVLVCAGSFINSRYVLTAAHCIEGKQTGLLTVVSKQMVGFARSEEKIIAVQKIVTHTSFDPETFDYDIGLLRLNETVHFNFWFKPICLPFHKSEHFEGHVATVVGWGSIHENASVPKAPKKLHKVKVPVVSNRACKNSSGLKTYLITERMLCAGDVTGGKDACQGDSGGPLMLKKRGQWTQIGIVSWGVGCARPEFYGVYTKLTQFLDWIQGNLEATWECAFS